MSATAAPTPTTPTTPAPEQGSASQGSASEVSVSQVRQWLGAGQAVLVDVRERDEHARERIGGAVLIPLSGFSVDQARALVKPGQRLVFHCKSGRRSAEACRLAGSLAEAGIPVATMTGGIEAWKASSLPVSVDTGVSRLSIMRQVQLVVGAGVLLGSGLAWLVHPWFLGIPAFLGAGLVFAGATGTCALATILGMMPWNRAPQGGTCATGSCCG